MKKLTLLTLLLWGMSILLFSQTLPTSSQVLSSMNLANTYFMKKWPNPGTAIVTDKTRPSNLWTRATYYEGFMQLYYINKNATYLKYAVDWGTANKWYPTYVGTATTRIADNLCCAQTYCELYQLAPTQTVRIATVQKSIDAMVKSTIVNDWWWIDAIQMAMPVFTKFGVIKNSNTYYEKMYNLWNYTKTKIKKVGLYNTTDHLWYRDSTYMPPAKSPNGLPIYWSRGNGWVFAALARTLDILPVTAPHRDEYITIFKEMAAKIITIQRTDGFWNCNLGDPNDYGGKETSGTAFFTYGLAWGINKGLLDTATYLTPVKLAWNGMVRDALHTNGSLGYVQSTGSKPADGQPLSYDKMPNFEDYGLGGFLLAGSQVYILANSSVAAKVKVADVETDTDTQQFNAYPNPFSNNLQIITNPEIGESNISIYNIEGRLVYNITVNNESVVNWDGRKNNGENLPNGIYFVRLRDILGPKTIKVILKR